MCNLAWEIAQANEIEIEALLDAVLRRYAILFPDWEVCTVSLQKSADRNEQLDRMIAMLQKMKTSFKRKGVSHMTHCGVLLRR